MKSVAETKEKSPNGVNVEPERPFVAPEVSIVELDDRFLLEAEMPGVGKGGLEVTVDGNTLVLVGRRSDAPVAGQLLHRESRSADYRRAFDLDPAIDTAGIVAEIRQGVLVLTLPKSERMKPRKINVR